MLSREILGQRLKSLRLSNNLTLEQAGTKFKVTKQTVSYWEKGERVPSFDVATALAEYYGVSLDYLAGLSNNPKRNK
ncbi:helix-turn-helix domain-containing protein [Propionispora vibrioides]|uniref:DNA-binding transcriptional regulator, XRE-family HTH domain n=1 Tax=Propionispora vibrioides TaxID=112903 RepID=A0A1H8UKD3_9FIRM|nr:helix-turn-helix transcriptional regulator [Propionispora vibrioides]SEP03324.1 DNA-binding transcriptional regulator, XRE-family HTH domain [Propionispora vibrioides]